MRVVNRLPFWMHQIIEYLIALLVATGAVRANQPVAVLTGAAVIALLASTSDAPLAAKKLVARSTQRYLDIGAAAMLVVLGGLFRDWLGPKGTFWLVAGGVMLAVLVWRTDYSDRRVRERAPRTRTIDARAVSERAQGASKVAGAISGRAAAAGRAAWRKRRG